MALNSRKLSHDITRSPERRQRAQSLLEKTYSTVDLETQLINAVARQDATDVDKLLTNNRRYDVNAVRNPGWAAIHHACKHGDVGILRALVNNGADVNLATRDGLLPLEIAVTRGHFELSAYLMEQGALATHVVHGNV